MVSGDQKERIVALPKPCDLIKAETQSDFLLNELDVGERTHEVNWISPAIWMSQRNSRDAVPLIFRGLFWTLVLFYTGITAENPETAGECRRFQVPQKFFPPRKLTWPFKNGGWETTFLCGRSIFRGEKCMKMLVLGPLGRVPSLKLTPKGAKDNGPQERKTDS